MSVLEVKNLRALVEEKEILKGVDLIVKTGRIHAIMGPNGTGKSILSAAVMGNPNYEVAEGEILFDGGSVLDSEVDERTQPGLSLAIQCPSEIPGITNAEFICAAISMKRDGNDKILIMAFLRKLDEKMALLNMPEETAERYLNKGFSGGEKRRNEILQLLMLEPTFAILDETDSGLDIDVLKVVAGGIDKVCEDNFSVLIITHYRRLLNYTTPDVVHIIMEGRVVMTGNADLAKCLGAEDYAGTSEELGIDYKKEEA